ncbi:MAG: SMI1/KNR4 family protein [Flavobacterium sp.]
MQISDYINYLQSNVIDTTGINEFNKEGIFFRIEKFYNYPDRDEFQKLNSDYSGRLGDGSFIIADAGNGDFVLMNERRNILFWNHEVNDLGYHSEAEKPGVVAKSLKDFLKSLVPQTVSDTEPEVISIHVSDDFYEKFKDYLK